MCRRIVLAALVAFTIAVVPANSSECYNCEERPETIAHLTYRDRNNDACNCTYSGGRDPNIRNNIEEMVRTLVQDNLAAAQEGITEKHGVNKHIREAAENIMLQISMHSKQIADKVDSANRDKNILEAIEILKSGQAAIEKDLQNCFTKQFQTIENNRIAEMNKFKEKITTLTNNVEHLTETITSTDKKRQESMEIINNKLFLLENMMTLEKQDIQNILNTNENIQVSVEKSSRELEALLNATSPTKDTGVVRSLCDVTLPSSLKINYGAWKDKQTPAEDDLDTFMAIKTGCSFTALQYDKNFDLPVVTYDGALFEWRVAVRSRDALDMGISWPGMGYSFFLGLEMNTVTKLTQWKTQATLEKATPGLLAADRYVPVYIRIQNGILTAGSECEDEPYFTQQVTIAQGQQVNMLFKTWSAYGAKYLYNCPRKLAGSA